MRLKANTKQEKQEGKKLFGKTKFKRPTQKTKLQQIRFGIKRTKLNYVEEE